VTLQDLGSIGEFLGAVGVILSLVYLAIQVRHNTRAVRSSTRQEVMRGMQAYISLVASDSDTANFYERGLSDSCDLSRAERIRFSQLLTQFFFSAGQVYDAYREGSLDPEAWEAQKEILCWYLKQPGVKRWWSNSRSTVPASFADFVEGEMG
jgi:hypothetical protein